MLLQEAHWLGARLAETPTEMLSPLIDLGSSTAHFRKVQQPYIQTEIFEPLSARSVLVRHVDVKAADGVDIVGNILNPSDRAALRQLKPRAVICANMLEHVPDAAEALRYCFDLLPSGGLLFLTVPYSFPYHADPFDTLFRPPPRKIAEMARPHDVRRCETVNGNSCLGEIRLMRSINAGASSNAVPLWRRIRPQTAHHLLWLFRPYKMTCAVIEKV